MTDGLDPVPDPLPDILPDLVDPEPAPPEPDPVVDKLPSADHIIAALAWLGVNLERIIEKLARRTPVGAIAVEELANAIWLEVGGEKLKDGCRKVAAELIEAGHTGKSEAAPSGIDLA